MVVLGDFKDWMALAFVRQILMFDKFAPGILAVIRGRMTGAEAYLACRMDGEVQSEDPPPEPVIIDVIEHKFDLPRDAESELRQRRRRGEVSGRDGRDAHRPGEGLLAVAGTVVNALYLRLRKKLQKQGGLQ